MANKQGAPMIHTGIGEKSVEALSAAIVSILSSDADEHTKIAALETLRHGTSVTGTTVSNSSFTRA